MTSYSDRGSVNGLVEKVDEIQGLIKQAEGAKVSMYMCSLCTHHSISALRVLEWTWPEPVRSPSG